MQTVIYYHRPVHSYHLLKTVMDYRSSLVWNCSMTSQKYRVVCLSASIIRNQLDKIWLSGNNFSFFIISFQIDRICTSEKKRAIAKAIALYGNFESSGFKVHYFCFKVSDTTNAVPVIITARAIKYTMVRLS